LLAATRPHEAGSFARNGVLFRGNAEGDIRKNLIQRGVCHLQDRAPARCVRHLSAPHGLLGRDDAADGWRESAQPELIVDDKSKKTKAKPDLVVGKKKYLTELIPPALLIARYFASEQAAVEKLEADLAALQQQMEEMAEEHGGEEGLLADAVNDKGKLTKASAAARLKEIKKDPDAADEGKAIDAYLALVEQEVAANAKLRAEQDSLAKKLIGKYPHLTVDEIKTLVVDDKWLATLGAAVQGELDRVSQTLTGRIRELADRYATPLPTLTDEVAALASRVDGHLKKMGAVWK
jgi:type I restriction enzyme M protein